MIAVGDLSSRMWRICCLSVIFVNCHFAHEYETYFIHTISTFNRLHQPFPDEEISIIFPVAVTSPITVEYVTKLDHGWKILDTSNGKKIEVRVILTEKTLPDIFIY